MLEKEFKYFQEHEKELLEKYLNKFIVIIGNEVIASYDSKEEALKETIKSHELGTFLIHYISKNSHNHIERFTSRVYV